jgi:hypothetical protein
MGVLRSIGRFFGRALRTIGNIGAKVISPLSQVAGAVAPAIQLAAPSLEKSGPVGAAIAKAAPLAPGILAVAQGIAGGIRNAGGKIAEAAK